MGRLNVFQHVTKAVQSLAQLIKLDPKADAHIDLVDRMLAILHDFTINNNDVKAIALSMVSTVPKLIWKRDSMQKWLVAILDGFSISLHSNRTAQKEAITAIAAEIFEQVATVSVDTTIE